MTKLCYIGTLVSEKDIYFKGQKQVTNTKNELGTLIAGGDIKLELRNAQLEQLNIQANEIFIRVVEDFVNKEIIKYTVFPDGKMKNVIDLVEFGKYLGFIPKNNALINQSSISSNFPYQISLMPETEDYIPFKTNESGFLTNKPQSDIFVSSIQNCVLNQLIKLILTPYKGREFLLRIDLINELKEAGSKLSDSVTNSVEMVLNSVEPALIFQKLQNKEVEMDINGEKVLVPLCNPYLILNTASRMMSVIKAEKAINLHTMGNINIQPTETNFDSPSWNLEAEGRVTIASEYKYKRSRGQINVASIRIPGSLTISGDKGVTTKGVELSANTLTIKSKNGDIIDFDMPYDMFYSYDMPYHDWYTITGHQDTHSSQFQANKIEIIAPNGTIDHHGTNIFAGKGGVTIEANNYKFQPSYQNDIVIEQRQKRSTVIEMHSPKEGGIISSGNVVFKTKDATLIGATIISPKISNPTDGIFRFLPAYADQHIWSKETKRNFWGKSTVEFNQYRRIPIGCKIIAHEFEFLGSGKLEMEGVTANIVEATIKKNLEERAAYETSHTVITQISSGLCPPKINGDCFIESIKHASKTMTCFQDVASNAFNLIGGFCQTAHDIDVLRNLSINENPMLSILQIFLSRFVTSFTFSNVKTVTTIDAKIAHQSNINIEVLNVSNDRTHLEGIWNLKKGNIETKSFTTKAPENTIHQHTETSGYCISLSPAAFLGACLCPGSMTFGSCLPTVSVFSATEDKKMKYHSAQVLSADDLFIRCDNAVFSGSTIQARIIEAIVSGTLTIEDLTNEFVTSSSSSSIGISIGAVFSLVQSMALSNENLDSLRKQTKESLSKSGLINEEILADTTFLDPKWKAIPQIRFAKETEIKKELQKLSSLIGKEQFYLKVVGLLHKKSAFVGLVPPDGIVTNTEKEKIEAGRILDEKIAETHQHKKHIFNPCIAEFIGMMSSYQSWQQTIENIELKKYKDALKEGKCAKDAHKEAKIKTKAIINAIDSLNESDLKLFLLLLIFKDQDEKDNKSRNSNKSEANKSFVKNNLQEGEHKLDSKKSEHKLDSKKSEHKLDSKESEHKLDSKESEHKLDSKNSQQSPKQNINKKDLQQEAVNNDDQKSSDKSTENKQLIKDFLKSYLTFQNISENDIENLTEKFNDYFFKKQFEDQPDLDIKKSLIKISNEIKSEGSNSSETSDQKYEGFDNLIYKFCTNIDKFDEFMQNNDNDIKLGKNILNTLMLIFMALNPEKSYIDIIKNVIPDIQKEMIDTFLSNTIDSALKFISEKITDKPELQEKLYNSLIILKNRTQQMYEFYDVYKGFKSNYSQIKKQGFKECLEKSDPVNKVFDSIINNNPYSQKKFADKLQNGINNNNIPKDHIFHMNSPNDQSSSNPSVSKSNQNTSMFNVDIPQFTFFDNSSSKPNVNYASPNIKCTFENNHSQSSQSPNNNNNNDINISIPKFEFTFKPNFQQTNKK